MIHDDRPPQLTNTRLPALVETSKALTRPMPPMIHRDRFENVGFWDALDVIGIQSYFPLVDHTALPTQDELDRAWAGLTRRLDRYGASQQRKVLLTELGYNRSTLAASSPWARRQGGARAEEIQRRCLDAALRALKESDGKNSDQVVGGFLWKWFPDQIHHEDFLMTTPAMRSVIQRYWGGRVR